MQFEIIVSSLLLHRKSNNSALYSTKNFESNLCVMLHPLLSQCMQFNARVDWFHVILHPFYTNKQAFFSHLCACSDMSVSTLQVRSAWDLQLHQVHVMLRYMWGFFSSFISQKIHMFQKFQNISKQVDKIILLG